MLSAPDNWRGTASAAEAAAAIGRGARAAGFEVDEAPLSDGGDGFLEVMGGPNRTARVTGPRGRPLDAGWRLDGPTAYLEMALCSGLSLAGGPERNDALAAGTRGTGELIAAAMSAGARRVVVGLGGSASTDGGLGCVEVLGDDPRISSVELVAACDVMVPFESAIDFAPQKGATRAEIRLLERRLERVAQIYQSELGTDVRDIPGAGAAGGLGGGLAALGATLVPGFDVVAEAVTLDERISPSTLVITGEGRLDQASFHGKTIGRVWEMASEAGADVLAVVGGADEAAVATAQSLGLRVVSLVEEFGPERAWSHTLVCIEAAVAAALRK